MATLIKAFQDSLRSPKVCAVYIYIYMYICVCVWFRQGLRQALRRQMTLAVSPSLSRVLCLCLCLCLFFFLSVSLPLSVSSLFAHSGMLHIQVSRVDSSIPLSSPEPHRPERHDGDVKQTTLPGLRRDMRRGFSYHGPPGGLSQTKCLCAGSAPGYAPGL